MADATSAASRAVDIGIPAFQRPHYIVEAIESVLAQTFTNWSLTVSEDGAGSEVVAEAVAPYLEDPRIAYRVVGKQVGSAANQTALIRRGSAPYVALLHDDDRWQPEFLARRIAFLQEHPECGLVFGRAREIDADGREIGLFRYAFPKGVMTPEELIPRLITARGNLIGHPPSILVRRTAYEAVGAAFRDVRVVVWEDYDMWFRIALKFPVGYLDVADSDYRVHSESLTRVARDTRKGVRKRELRVTEERVSMIDAALPGLLGWRERGDLWADLALASALDEAEDGNLRVSAHLVAAAIRRYPPAAVDPRIPAWLVGLVLGQRARNALARLRSAVVERRMRRRTNVLVSSARRRTDR